MAQDKNGFKVDVTEEKGCRLLLKVTVAQAEAQKAYKQAIKLINKEISVPGFRKGKAPEESVVSKYPSQIDKEWKDILINEAFQAALTQTKIYPYSKKTIEKARLESCSMEGATVLLAYERYPAIPDVDFSSISLPKTKKKAIADSEVDKVVLEVQKAHATFEEEASRPLKLGDYVDLSIDKIDEEPPHSLIKERRFEVTDEMLPWLKKMILGLEPGASVEGMTEPDPQADEKVKADYVPAKVRVTVHGIKKSLLPALDDELAKKAGASSKEDLIQKIRANLEKDAELEQKEQKIKALEALLLKKYPFEIPASLLEAEISDRIREQVTRLREEGASEDRIQEEEKQLKESVSKEASDAIHLHFLMTHIGEKDRVELTKEELNHKLTEEMMRNPYYMTLQKQNSELFGKIINRLSTRFLFDKIREHALAKVVD